MPPNWAKCSNVEVNPICIEMKRDLNIRFSGLNEGLHDFHFKVGNEFFEQIDYSDIKGAELKVDVQMEKRINMLILNFDIIGTVNVMCDKCTNDFDMSVENAEEIIYKFGEGESDDEKIVIIPENEIELDVSQAIYELTVIAVPSKRVHPKGECNQEMLKAMDDYLMVESDELTSEDELTDQDSVSEEEIDPRWEELKKLKKEK